MAVRQIQQMMSAMYCETRTNRCGQTSLRVHERYGLHSQRWIQMLCNALSVSSLSVPLPLKSCVHVTGMIHMDGY